MIERSEKQNFSDGTSIRICSASDLVILKAFANRPRDWQDIRGILIRSGSHLNWKLIDTELEILENLKEEPESLTQLAKLRTQFS